MHRCWRPHRRRCPALSSVRPRAGSLPIESYRQSLSRAFSWAAIPTRTVALVKDGARNIWIAPLTPSGPTGAATQRTFENEGGAWPAWSPDGRWIGYQCSAGTNAHLCMIGATEGERVEVVSADGTVFQGGWFTDNDRLLFAAKRDAVWNVAWVSRTTRQTTMVTRFTDPHSSVRNPKWDAAHRRVVFERAETVGRVWMVTLPSSPKK